MHTEVLLTAKDTWLVLSAAFLLNRLFFHSIGLSDSQSHTLKLSVEQVLIVLKQHNMTSWLLFFFCICLEKNQ